MIQSAAQREQLGAWRTCRKECCQILQLIFSMLTKWMST